MARGLIDLAPVARLVAALSRAALTLRDQVREFELNPVIVHADGSGLTVADALLTMKDPRETSRADDRTDRRDPRRHDTRD